MKGFKKLLLAPLGFALLCLAGCGGNAAYTVYTNIPEGEFSVLDDRYSVGGIIGGYTLPPPSNDTQDENASNYKTLGYSFYTMYVDAQLVVAYDWTDERDPRFVEFSHAVYNLVDSIAKTVSTTVTGSDIYRFNAADAGEEIEISKTAYEILGVACSVYTLTEGCYNPALYYNVEAYGFGNSHEYPKASDELPSEEAIAQYTALASHFGELSLREEEGRYYARKPDATAEVGGTLLTMKLDLSGISKGYAVDKVDELFDEYGYRYGYFNFGTSSMLVKNHAAEGVYNLSFSDPRSPSRDQFMRVNVRNEKFSTSGDSEQYYMLDGRRYCHIIDPETGKPVQTGIMSVTVIGGSAAEDDALTTAIMAMEKEDAIRFIQEKLTDRRVAFTFE